MEHANQSAFSGYRESLIVIPNLTWGTDYWRVLWSNGFNWWFFQTCFSFFSGDNAATGGS
jgi:hypothetical protein